MTTLLKGNKRYNFKHGTKLLFVEDLYGIDDATQARMTALGVTVEDAWDDHNYPMCCSCVWHIYVDGENCDGMTSLPCLLDHLEDGYYGTGTVTVRRVRF